MSMYRHRDSLLWLSLFSIPSEKEKKQLLKRIQAYPASYTAKALAIEMLNASGIEREYRAEDPCIQAACEYVALKFMLHNSDLAKDLLNEEEFAKASEVYARKQYNSKLLQALLQNFLKLLYEQQENKSLKNLFTISIMDAFKEAQAKEVDRTYGALKKTIEKVAAGIKSNCYYEANSPKTLFFDTPLDDALNQILATKSGYDFNHANPFGVRTGMSTLFCNAEHRISNEILRYALVEDADFWSKHEHFDVIVFLNEIAKQNDVRHAEKVLLFIAESLQKMPHMELVLQNGFPLCMSKYDELVENLEEQAYRFSFKRLEPYCDTSKLKGVSFCYPMRKAEPTSFKIGQRVWERFIREYNYPKSYEKVEAYLAKEIQRFLSGETHEDHDIAVILDAAPFRYDADHEDRRLFTAYHPDCFSEENIWKRVYLKAYAVTRLSDDKQLQFSYLQRIFVDLIKTIERLIGICTVHQLDRPTRTKHYDQLKERLKEYGVNITDEHKGDYIVSLLDRDTARIEEAKMFPVLEQIGDAIYGLAVAELLFYDPDIDGMAKQFEYFTRAETQVLLSKRTGFDQLYLQIGVPAKYMEYNTLYYDDEASKEEQFQALNQEKYLADSLEMIIGSVYRDVGIEQAVNLVKKLLLKAFSKQLHEPVLLTEENKHDPSIDRDYWARILPSPCAVMTEELHTLWDALNKVILIHSLGTDDKNKRRYITYSFGNTAIYGENGFGRITWAFYDYLSHGLLSVLEKYGDRIRSNYNSNGNAK